MSDMPSRGVPSREVPSRDVPSRDVPSSSSNSSSTSGSLPEGVVRIRRGKVWLVGAGPGDPELLTLKAVRALSEADVVAYDELVSEPILDLAPKTALRVPVGRRAGGVCYNADRIHPAVIEHALAGRTVVRLKGGDPFVFGRGGEEAEELAAARIPFEVVPGISAALGAAASSGIPLTHRDASSSVTLATAHLADEAYVDADGRAVATGRLPKDGTIVFYMGLARVRATCAALVAAGRPRDLPAAVISRATLPDQRVVVGTLGTLADLVDGAKVPSPALLFVGDVVARAVTSPREVVTASEDALWAEVAS